jgi:hypothetical protein
MRIWIAVVLAACGGGTKTTEPPRPPEATCARAAQQLIELLPAAMAERPSDEQMNQFIAILRDTCEKTQWSAQARQCFADMKVIDDAKSCVGFLTEAQQRNLQIGSQEKTGDEGAAPPPPAGPSDPGRRPKGSGDEDPCAGGE